MTLFHVRDDDAAVFDHADLTDPGRAIAPDAEVEAAETQDERVVQVTAVAGAPTSGFMRRSALTPLDTPIQPPDSTPVFFGWADAVARDRGVDRDYLVALAWAESKGLTALGTGADPAMGPFMFTRSTWRAAIASPRAPAGLRLSERGVWGQQVSLAAIVALDAVDALTPVLGRPPTVGMLYFAHVFGVPAATALLPDTTRRFDATYTGALGAAAFATCRSERGTLLGAPGTPIRTIFDAQCDKLDTAYLDAAAALDRQTDDVRFFHSERDDPRWLMVAREEAFRGVYEQTGATNNARIVQYLRATGLSASSDEVPWCAAFVTFCMQQAGVTVPHDPARAASWLGWGAEAPAGERVPGMVVVLKPQARGSSGHVGFLVQDAAGPQPAPGRIRLLAGNQGSPQRVCVADVAEDQVAPHGFRVLAGTSPASPISTPGSFRTLVPGGFFSGNPNSGDHRSIRTNNPGALNWTRWQTQRHGFFGKTAPDAEGNETTIYLTPEQGVAAWFTLLAIRYGLGPRYGLRTLAARYGGSPGKAAHYLSQWVSLSEGRLAADTIVDTGDDAGMLALAKAMFHHEAGVATPLGDAQILFGIQAERANTLPA